MNTYKAVIFDLDGTLVDSLQDIADSMNRTLTQFGFPTYDYPAYKYFVGNGLKTLVDRCLPEHEKNEELAAQVLAAMISDYRANLVKKTCLYPGIQDLLDQLIEKGIKLCILSNKADELTQEICSVLLASRPFEMIVGAGKDFPRKPDPAAACHIAGKMKLLPREIVYVGDTNVDMQTANAAGMLPVGVTWGFRPRKELEESGAKCIIDDPLELMDIWKVAQP